jgi:hypothetical protein
MAFPMDTARLPPDQLRDTLPLRLRLPRPRVGGGPLPSRPEPESTAGPEEEVDAPFRRPPSVLAPILPALLLVAVCIAGLSDPRSAHGGSRLHVPAPVTVPAVPLTH